MPSYSGGGSGEYALMRELAMAASQHWPHASIEFLLPGDSKPTVDLLFPSKRDPGTAKHRNDFYRKELKARRPDLAIFLPKCSERTLFLCRYLGIRTAQITTTPYPFRKTFYPWRFNIVDAHWHMRISVLEPAYTPWQALLTRLSSTERRVFDTYLGAGSDDKTALPQSLNSVIEEPYVLFAPGGGGYEIRGRPVADIYFEAAHSLQERAGVRTIILPGVFNTGHLPTRGPIIAPPLSVAQVVRLMRNSRAVITNGGTMLHQALAVRVPSAAAALGGSDQSKRIEDYSAAGLIVSTEPNACELVTAAIKLLAPAVQQSMRERLSGLHLADGIPMMIEGMARLLGERRRLRLDL